MVTVVVKGILCKTVSEKEAMAYVWDPDLNTEEHPVHIFDENGNEVEW